MKDSVRGFRLFIAFIAVRRKCSDALIWWSFGRDFRYCTNTRAATYKQNVVKGFAYLVSHDNTDEILNLLTRFLSRWDIIRMIEAISEAAVMHLILLSAETLDGSLALSALNMAA